MGQQINVEDVAAIQFLIRHQQVDQQGGDPSLLKMVGDIAVARAEPTAPAPMSEEDDTDGSR